MMVIYCDAQAESWAASLLPQHILVLCMPENFMCLNASDMNYDLQTPTWLPQRREAHVPRTWAEYLLNELYSL